MKRFQVKNQRKGKKEFNNGEKEKLGKGSFLEETTNLGPKKNGWLLRFRLNQ